MTRLFSLLSVIIVVCILFSFSGVAENSQRPQVVIPRLPGSPPTIDGRLSEGEWHNAAIITGMGLYGESRIAYRQSQFWVGYDDTNLYVAIKSPVYPKNRRLVSLRQRRDGGFYGDDVIEILLDPNGGRHTGSAPYFYFIGNSAGVICHDSREMPGIGQSDLKWNGHWKFANQVDADWWTAELSIPLKDLQVEDMKNHPLWTLQFSRTYARPVVWTNFPNIGQINNPIGAAYALTEEGTPFLRLESVAALITGMKDVISGEVVNPGKKESNLVLSINIKEGTRILAGKNYSYSLKGGQRSYFTFSEEIELPSKAVGEIVMKEKETGKLLVYNNFPFVKNIPLPELQEESDKSNFAHRIRYLPSINKLVVWADIFGHPHQQEIESSRLIIKAEDGRQVYSKVLALSPGGLIDEKLEVSALEEGKYNVELILADREGKRLDGVSHSMVVRHYPWLGSGIGKTDDVLPPWTPMKVIGRTVECWGRQYTFNGLGLPESVKTKGERMLSGPVVLLGIARGKPFSVQAGPSPDFLKKTPASVVMRGTGKGQGITVQTVSTMEYDGMVKVEMEIIPEGKIKLDGLQLIIPYPKENAPLIHEVSDHIRTGQYSGLLSEGEGVVWNSKDDI
ncbi:MAG: DUF6067 family protein, partial [Candidatus Omnitrophica bacterium]|nr:DUF6067 family protein [Candidatus Omnitrophota bacterium]